MVLSWKAGAAGHLHGQVGVAGLSLTVGMESRGVLAQESEYNLLAAYGS